MKKLIFLVLSLVGISSLAQDYRLNHLPRSYAECKTKPGSTVKLLFDNGSTCATGVSCKASGSEFKISLNETFTKCVTQENLADSALRQQYESALDPNQEYIYDPNCKSKSCARRNLMLPGGGQGGGTFSMQMSGTNICYKQCRKVSKKYAKGKKASKAAQKRCQACLFSYKRSQCLMSGSSLSSCMQNSSHVVMPGGGGVTPHTVVIDDGSLACTSGSSLHGCVPERDISRALNRDDENCEGCRRGRNRRDRRRRNRRDLKDERRWARARAGGNGAWPAIGQILSTGLGAGFNYLSNKRFADSCTQQASSYYTSVDTHNYNVTARDSFRASEQRKEEEGLMKPKQYNCNGHDHRSFAGYRGGNVGGLGFNPWFGNSFNGSRAGLGNFNSFGGFNYQAGVNFGGGLNNRFQNWNSRGGQYFPPGRRGGGANFGAGVNWNSGRNGHLGSRGGAWASNGSFRGGYDGSGINPPYWNNQAGRGLSSRRFNNFQDSYAASEYQNSALWRDAARYQDNYNFGASQGYNNPWGSPGQHFCQSPFGC